MKYAIIKIVYFFISICSIHIVVHCAQADDGMIVHRFVENELLIKFKSDVSNENIQMCANEYSLKRIKEFSKFKVSLHKIRGGRNVASICNSLCKDPRIEYAEPNYIVKADAIPNDPRFSELWGLHNTGQAGGTPDADIDASEAWDLNTGDSNIVVGVIDTGVDYNHEDLAVNIWVNSGEIPGNGVDDDGNGYIDDIHGIDVANNDGDPFDDDGHGTHVSGTIGAVGNNSVGVAGVNWNVKIMALKFLDSSRSGTTAGAIECLNYVIMMRDNGVKIVLTSNSWGGGGFSQALRDTIEATGILFVAAAGNGSTNNDVNPHYPSSYDSINNVLSVASVDRNDNLSSFSNYGLQSVDIGAPGSNILSTAPGNSYAFLSGTSMATAHVSGVAALLLAANADLTFQELKARIMLSSDPVSGLDGRTVTGGRLNVHKALTGPYLPAANFVADNICGTPPLTVNFSNLSRTIGFGVTYSWNFGDGTTSTAENPSHTYSVDGGFTVSLTVQDSNGSDTKTISGYIRTKPPYSVLDSNGPDGPAFNWINISSTGTPLNLGDDSGAIVTLPFLFDFYDTNFNQVFVNSNGNLTFGGPFTGYSNSCLPTSDTSNIIAGFWDDLNPSAGGNVYYEVKGTSPNRKFIVEWYNVPHFSNIGDATFEIILHEGSNEIILQYLDVSFENSSYGNGISATIGIQSNPNACDTKFYSCNEAVLSDQLAIQFIRDNIDNDLISIDITSANPSIIIGNTQPFIATGTYQDGSTADITVSVTWVSNDISAATIDANGLATGIGAGSAGITASLNIIISPASVLNVLLPDGDTDNDRMKNGWELTYGLDPLLDDGSGDLDVDDITNYQEYLNGTNPTLRTPTVTSILPNTENNDGSVYITDLVGANFQDPATVKLTMSGEPDIVASNVLVNVNTLQIVCAFDLTGVVPGAWDVEVTIPNGETGILQSGFTVTAAVGLLGNWKFEDGGGSVASDSSGNGIHGTVNNGAAWNTTGAIGGALDFDGTDDYVDVGDIDLTDSFTIAAWVKLSGTGKSMIVGKTYQTYQFYVSPTGRLVFQRNSSTAINYNADLTTGKWYHVAVTFNTTDGMVMYLDGSAVATDGNITPTNTNNVATKIGATGWTASHFFNGTLDEVRMYGIALTAQKVQGLVGNISFATHYAFEGNADDSSGNGNHGTVNGGAGWAAGENGNGLGILCDGVDDYVDAGDIDLTDSFTIAAWVKQSSTGKSMIVGKTYQSYQFYVSPTGRLVFQRNSNTAINYNAGLTVGTWYHVAVTFNTTDGMVMYLDGSAVATDDNITPTNTNNVATKIGATGWTASHFFNGTLDEIRMYGIALTAQEVQGLVGNISFATHYAFEGNADDSSGNENHGTVNGGAGWAAGENGNGLGILCDGVDDYVDAGDIDLTDSFTIAAWVRLSGAGKSMIVGKTYQSYQFFVAGTGVLVFQRNSTTPINYDAGLMVGKWHHVAVTFNTTAGMVMYLDGSAVATDGNITPTNTNNVATKIGATGLTAMYFFNGTLDEVRVRDTALTALEVFDLFNN